VGEKQIRHDPGEGKKKKELPSSPWKKADLAENKKMGEGLKEKKRKTFHAKGLNVRGKKKTETCPNVDDR